MNKNKIKWEKKTGKWKKVEDDQTKVEVKVDEEPKQDKVDNEDKEEEKAPIDKTIDVNVVS